jgi:endonuclease/exonuclease/phosphatase family metal-dependent hydrolase
MSMDDPSYRFKLLEGEHPDLAHWHGNVGEAIALDLAGPLVRNVSQLDVLSWNIAIGKGRLVEVVNKLKAGELDGEKRPANRPLIILAQEAFRTDNSVPEQLQSRHHGGHAPKRERFDIVEMAHELKMSLCYAPSMRNGAHRSDRGNAILSSVSMVHARAFPLPHVRQRRIAIAAELNGLPWLTLVCAHLDTRGRVQGKSGRLVQGTELGHRLLDEWGSDQTILLGADFNSYLGHREPLFRDLTRAGFERLVHGGRSRHTFHATGFRMMLDHFLVRTTPQAISSIDVIRIDESAADKERFIFGSDHHPLLARITFAAPNRRIKQS